MPALTKHLKYFIFLFVVAVVMYLVINGIPVAPTASVRAEGGVADLTGISFADNIAAVSGWESYPDRLYDPADFASGITGAPSEFTDRHATTAQYGTHRLLLRMPQNAPVGISFRSLDYATRVFIDGIEAGEMGKVGTTREETIPRTSALAFYVTPVTPETEIIIQYANFVHKDGGRPPVLTIGSAANVTRIDEKAVFSQSVIMGVLFMSFLYHMGIFFLYGMRREYLYFALTCLLFGLRASWLVPAFFPDYNWQIAIRWEYLNVFFAFLFLTLFLRRLLPEILDQRLMLAPVLLLALYDVMVLVTQASFFSRFVPFMQMVCTLTLLYVTVRLGMALGKGRLRNILAFGGILLFTALTVNDALALNNLPNLGSNNMLPTGTIIFMLAYMLILAVDTAEREREMELTKLRIETQMTLQAKRFEQLADAVEHTRRERHDLRHHLSVISSYLESDSKDALRKYLADYIGSTPADDDPPVCSNLAVDAVVRHYLERAKAKGVALDIRLNLPPRAGVPDADLCIVFGNIFENAALALERQTEGERFITARCAIDVGKIVLTVDNSVTENEKRNDGVGLKSVAVIAERHGGGARFENDKGIFHSSVQLNIQ